MFNSRDIKMNILPISKMKPKFNSSSILLTISVLHHAILLDGRTDAAAAQYNREEIHSSTSNYTLMTEAEARQLMQELDIKGSQECTKYVKASWAYQSNITEKSKEGQLSAKLEYAEWLREQWERTQAVPKPIWENFNDEDLKRKFHLMSVLGIAALDVKDLNKFNNLVTEMIEMYSTAKVCDYINSKKCDLSLDPDLTRILRTSRNYDELEYVWKAWRHETGRLMRDHYKEFVHLANKAAELNDFDNMGDMWTYSYETDNFKDIMEELWEQLKPLYQQVHAYVRRKLREVYGENRISQRGPIPAHLLGNMWSQTWGNINDIVIPYPNKTSVNVTPQMIKQNYTPQKMFELSDKFFTSLNLIPMQNKFWEDSIIEKPEGREMVCHASAWDFCNGQDFRIKQCTVVTMEDLVTVHHEMGHIQYFLQYKDQPLIYRDGANPGFHEAVGDVLALSVATPKHLKKIGLLHEVHNDEEAEINFLMGMALDKIVFLPFGYLMDRWRWNVFSGETDMKDRNCDWWDLRYKIQGIKPPVQRSEADFDPGAKYHIPANVPYIRYFVSFVIQFQFHKALCLKANEYDPQDPMKPLHQCDIYQSTEAGNALGELLKLGASKHWPVAMKALTGGEKMDASVIREYFMPLEKWLTKENKKHNEFIGWEKDDDDEYCVTSPSDVVTRINAIPIIESAEEQCRNKNGFCVHTGDRCNGTFDLIPSSFDIYCVCCLLDDNQDSAKKQCRDKNGFCVHTGDRCYGTFDLIQTSFDDHCDCCVPDDEQVSAEEQCRYKNGFCVHTGDRCDGTFDLIHTSFDIYCACCVPYDNQDTIKSKYYPVKKIGKRIASIQDLDSS